MFDGSTGGKAAVTAAERASADRAPAAAALVAVPAVSRAQTIAPFGGKVPTLGEDVFVAPNASVSGDVTLGAGSSVWYGAVIRGAHRRRRGVLLERRRVWSLGAEQAARSQGLRGVAREA